MNTRDHDDRSSEMSRRTFISSAAGSVGAAAFIAASLGSEAEAQSAEAGGGAPFNYDFPYTSQRMPVMARNIVATSQPLAAQAGLDILRAGGNAMDAAIATAAALTVVEPTSNGIGSDNFALVWSAGRVHGLNASGRAPIELDRSRYSTEGRIPFYGWDGVTTPGAVSGWAAMHERFGRLPFKRIIEPAVRYARDGFLVSPEVARYWKIAASRYVGDPVFKPWHDTFAPDGRTPAAGDLFRSADHADTLQAIAETTGRDFYEGKLAGRIADAAAEGGSALSRADLSAHAPEWVKPISIDYRGWRLHEIPPNGQGIAALIALGILRQFDMKSLEVDSVESLHLQIEAMKLAFADTHRHVADPDHMEVSPAALLDDHYLQSRAALIDPAQAQNFDHGKPLEGGTVLLTTADAEGNMVSFIQSNYTGFGSGVVIPGTGVAMQNRACCFSLEPGHPNEVGPNKLPYHTIIPGFVTRIDESGDEVPVMSFGVMGGYMQPQGHAQVLMRIADWKQNPQSALDAPRWQVFTDLNVSVEPGFPKETYESLRALGHNIKQPMMRNASFGRGQIIFKLDDGYVGASDLRADGQAVGY